ncbi:hypothetical protein A8V01_11640 [Novosphingobium guangzhouense]|uniref:DoxX family protein n=2 Tax=Novosphingobium guangzhouense TaxID=1850347 RepID=A0A2K2FSU5_9SPHN|nr:hypothetical protein [Novosphingobium guangzhouense]PNU01834.1 hypothetical protein A8V01_11640 [Novosphingobium guangzhouense]
MAPLILVFCFGIVNFAAHKALLESNHPMLAQVPWFFQALGGRLSLVVEFVMLLGVMIVAAAGSTGWALLYALYTALNGVSAWLIFSGRV